MSLTFSRAFSLLCANIFLNIIYLQSQGFQDKDVLFFFTSLIRFYVSASVTFYRSCSCHVPKQGFEVRLVE